MKIRRLDLIAYGPFENEVLEFSSDNLHVVYGPNEAGKSTALRALQAVLYGMTEKRDAFLHPWDLMRVGMWVEAGNQLIRVERRKGKGARSLVYAGTERAVTGEEWNRVLPVLSQNLFVQMFGLDYQRLVEGGRELAEGKGDIGQALLSAAGDLGNAVERMHACEARAAALFQPHARSQSKLSVALRQYKEAEKRIRCEKYSSHAYRTAVKELEEQQRESERITREMRSCAAEHAGLARLQQAAPAVALLQQKESALAGMANITLLPADFAGRHQDAERLLAKALTTAENSQSELERLTQKLAATPSEPALAALKIEIEALFAQSGKIESGREDRPKREGELRHVRERASRNLRLLGLTSDPDAGAQLRVTLLQRNEVKRLADDYPKLITLLGEAAKNIEKLQAALEENQYDLQNLPEGRDTAALERCLAGLAATPSEKETAKARTQTTAAEMRAEAALKALPLFAGTADELESLQAPLPSTVRSFQTRYDEQCAAEQQHETDEADARIAITSLEQKLHQLEDRKEVPTQADLEDSRATRELGWTAVKQKWIRGGSDAAVLTAFLSGPRAARELDVAYEEAVQDADNVADRLREDASSVEKKALFLEQLAGSKEELQGARDAKAHAAAARRRLDAEWTALWAPTSVKPRTPAEMLDWLDTRRDVVTEVQHAAEMRRDLNQTEGQVEIWRAALAGALTEFGERTPGSLAELAEAARKIVETATETRSKRRDLAKDQRRLESERIKAERRRAELEGELAEWRSQWAKAIAGLPVPAGAKPDFVQEVVRTLDEIATDAEQICGLVHRVETMERDDNDFSGKVSGIAARAGVQLDASDALVVIKKLNQLATAAKQNQEAAATLREDIQRTRETLRTAGLEAERQRKALSALCAEAGVAGPECLVAAIENSATKRELAGQIADQQKALAAACAGRSLGELVTAVGNLDLDALPGQLKELEERQQRFEEQRQACSRRALELEKEFEVHESAARLSQAAAEKQDASARILDLTEQYLEQEVSARLLNAAIERYRRRHQDPLLERAGQHLERLTCGSFSALAVDFEEGNRRVLRAVRKDSG